MNSLEIATALYNACLDMDQFDYIELLESDINILVKEIELLKINNCNGLLQALEIILNN